MPPRKDPDAKLDCSKRSVNPFQTYVNHLITKKPEKIKLLIARALMNDDYLMDFNGQVHANECVFSYPDSNWYSVYLLNNKGEQYFGEDGALKFYFQMEFQMEKGVPVDATIINGTSEVPDELMVNGKEKKNCMVKENGKCGNPEPKRKKKTTIKAEDYDSSDDEESSEKVLEKLKNVPVGNKQKVPRDFFEGKSKLLIIDWMIANMKPEDILKCIKRNLSPQDVKEAESLLDTKPSDEGSSSSYLADLSKDQLVDVLSKHNDSDVNQMLKTVTKSELVGAVNRIKDRERKMVGIIGICKRAGVKDFSLEKSAKTGKHKIVDSDGDPVDSIDQVLDICAEKEAMRIKKILKLKSISSDVKKGIFTKDQVMNYRGGNVRLPFSMKDAVKTYFPLVKNLKNENGELFGQIPSEKDSDGDIIYFKYDDILGKDLKKLDDKIRKGKVLFGKKRTFKKKVKTVKKAVKKVVKKKKTIKRKV